MELKDLFHTFISLKLSHHGQTEVMFKFKGALEIFFWNKLADVCTGKYCFFVVGVYSVVYLISRITKLQPQSNHQQTM